MKRPIVIAFVALPVFVGLVGLVGLAALVAPRFGQRTEETSTHFVCTVCGSTRVEERSVVDGVETRATDRTRPSAVFTDLLDHRRHEHHWVFSHSNSEVREGMTITRAHGDGFPAITGRASSRFVWLYNGNPGFRAFVQRKIRAGEMTRGRAAGFVFIADDDPRCAFPEDVAGPFDDFPGDLYSVGRR